MRQAEINRKWLKRRNKCKNDLVQNKAFIVNRLEGWGSGRPYAADIADKYNMKNAYWELLK